MYGSFRGWYAPGDKMGHSYLLGEVKNGIWPKHATMISPTVNYNLCEDVIKADFPPANLIHGCYF